MASQAVSNPDAEAISVTFDLIDFGRTGEISEAALAQSLLQTGCTHIDTAQARAISANAVRDGNKIDKNVFANVLMEAIDNERASSSACCRSRSDVATLAHGHLETCTSAPVG